MRPLTLTGLTLIVAAAVAFGAAGCSRVVPLQAAAHANDPHCASVIVRLPDTVAKLSKRETNAQSTGAWGDPDAIVLTCGTEPIGPTTLDCVSVNGIDWVVDDREKPLYRFSLYGREPGLEVRVDSSRVSGTDALVDLGKAVQVLPQTRHCVGPSDTLDFKN